MKQISKNIILCLTVSAALLSGFSTSASACSFLNSTVYGARGGFTFYNGLIVQKDPQTGKTLTANQALTVSSVAACAQACLADANCTGVSYRSTSNKQCLTFASYDFETNRTMDLWLHSGGGNKYKSAIIRSRYHGSVCD